MITSSKEQPQRDIDPDTDANILAGKRIGLFGKGGAGKSTSVVLLARLLRELRYDVCILDADSTNIGLPYALGIDQHPVHLLEYFGGTVFSGGLVTCPVDDPNLLPGRHIYLDELPQKYYRKNKDGITLLTAGKIGDQGPGAGCDGPVSKIARDLRIHGRHSDPVTLIDFKAGFEDSARGVITSLDWVIVLVDPTIAAVEMAFNMRDMINQIKDGRLPATQHLADPGLVAMANKLYLESKIKGVLFILNKIRSPEVEHYLRSKLAEKGIVPSGVIPDDPAICTSWLEGTPIKLNQLQTNLIGLIQKLEAAEAPAAIRQITA